MTLKSTGFIGFPDIKMKPVILPDHFFIELLPQIDDLAELKLTLHCFWLLNEQEGELRYLRGDDLRTDARLLQSLTLDSDLRTPPEALAAALQRAVARNTLLKLEIEAETGESEQGAKGNGPGTEGDGEGAPGRQPATHNLRPAIEDWYFMNTVRGRQTLALIRQGKLKDLAAAIPDEARLRVKRPNIYVLYEQNISLMTPLIADQLRDMEKTYSPDWIEEAFEIAVSRNKRNLRYIQSILRRWETEGKDLDSHEGTRRNLDGKEQGYLPDEFSDIIIR